MLNLGSKARDKVSGVEGILTVRTEWLHGGDRYDIQPPSKDGKIPDSQTFDEPQIEILESAPKHIDIQSPANCGDLVEDPITKTKGIVIGIGYWLYGCTRCCVQPKIDRKGHFVESRWFDADRLIITKRAQVVKSTGTIMDAANLAPPRRRYGPVDSKPTRAQ